MPREATAKLPIGTLPTGALACSWVPSLASGWLPEASRAYRHLRLLHHPAVARQIVVFLAPKNHLLEQQWQVFRQYAWQRTVHVVHVPQNESWTGGHWLMAAYGHVDGLGRVR